MADINQSIHIKADITGLDQVRRGKSDIGELKKAVEAIDKTGTTRKVTPDMPSPDSMKKQVGILKEMDRISTKMMRDMKRGEFIGTKEYVKGLDQSLQKLKKMYDVVEDMGDEQEDQHRKNERARNRVRADTGVTGAAARVGGGIAAVGGALAGGDIVGGGITAIGRAGAAVKQVGEEAGEDAGTALAKAGLWGLVASGVLAGLSGLDRLIYGEFEKVAPQLYQHERAAGVNITSRRANGEMSVYEEIRRASEAALLDRAQVMQARDVVRGVAGTQGAGTTADIIAMMRTGVGAETAGQLLGMERRFAGGMTGGGFVGLAKAGGYAKRTEEFGRMVTTITQSLQDMGVDIGSEAGAQIVSRMGDRYGEIFRGGAGTSAIMGMTQAMQGAMALQTPEQAMMFRALRRGTFRETMLAMEEGAANTENIDSMIAYVQGVAPDDPEAQARMLERMGVKGYRRRLTMLGEYAPETTGGLERGRRTRAEVGVTEAGKVVQATLPLEIKSEAGYITIVRGYIRGMILGAGGAESGSGRMPTPEEINALPPEERRRWLEAQYTGGGQGQVRAPSQLQLEQKDAQRREAETGGVTGAGQTSLELQFQFQGNNNTSEILLPADNIDIIRVNQ